MRADLPWLHFCQPKKTLLVCKASSFYRPSLMYLPCPPAYFLLTSPARSEESVYAVGGRVDAVVCLLIYLFTIFFLAFLSFSNDSIKLHGRSRPVEVGLLGITHPPPPPRPPQPPQGHHLWSSAVFKTLLFSLALIFPLWKTLKAHTLKCEDTCVWGACRLRAVCVRGLRTHVFEDTFWVKWNQIYYSEWTNHSS